MEERELRGLALRLDNELANFNKALSTRLESIVQTHQAIIKDDLASKRIPDQGEAVSSFGAEIRNVKAASELPRQHQLGEISDEERGQHPRELAALTAAEETSASSADAPAMHLGRAAPIQADIPEPRVIDREPTTSISNPNSQASLLPLAQFAPEYATRSDLPMSWFRRLRAWASARGSTLVRLTRAWFSWRRH